MTRWARKSWIRVKENLAMLLDVCTSPSMPGDGENKAHLVFLQQILLAAPSESGCAQAAPPLPGIVTEAANRESLRPLLHQIQGMRPV
jgi:hypothetical protein